VGTSEYAFVRVEGDGVHEIPVGPVHAGIIEPGHFRFSVVGEKVLRLEQRLGYTHKGVEKRFTELPPLAGASPGRTDFRRFDGGLRLGLLHGAGIARGLRDSERAGSLRALLLERERVANHLGDLGALGNDAAFAFGLAQFSRLREDWLRLSQEAFGHRLMMDCVVPGGVASDIDGGDADRLSSQCDVIEREVLELRQVYDEHAGLQDRFMTTGRVTPELAAQLGLTGLAGRASGAGRRPAPRPAWPPYDRLACASRRVARATSRRASACVSTSYFESLRLLRLLLARPGAGDTRGDCAAEQGRVWRRRLGRRLARRGLRRARMGRRAWRQPSVAATSTIPPGRTGRCSNTR
jgi:Ni,Fe-hydrogenase III large subunit